MVDMQDGTNCPNISNYRSTKCNTSEKTRQVLVNMATLKILWLTFEPFSAFKVMAMYASSLELHFQRHAI